jgi:polyisoprenoid-binding protein YceI
MAASHPTAVRRDPIRPVGLSREGSALRKKSVAMSMRLRQGIFNRRSYVLFTLCAALLWAAAPVAAAQQSEQLHLHLDPAQTEIHFTLKDTLHTVHGTFRLSSGEIFFNPQLGAAHGLISVDTVSGASGNDTRDGRMKKEFLETPKFTVASFEPLSVTGFNPALENQKITFNGNLTLHGTAHALTLNFEIGRAGQAITATTHFPIPYVAWGIKDPSNFAIKVDKEVSMDIIAKGSLTTEK